jgi:ADP-ribosylglycohydrolase
MVSDDTEHAVMTLLSLRESDGDAGQFEKALARHLRWWLAAVPAGVGLATARSILKLWIGFPPSSSGVVSAGNGPLMRAPVIGLFFNEDAEQRERHIKISTSMTHRDPRAVEAALMIGEATAIAAGPKEEEDQILRRLERHVTSDEMRLRFAKIREHLAARQSVNAFADSFSRKAGFVSGFAPDTAAVAIYAWLHHRGDFTATVESVIRCGGDTDTVAFVAGSIAGAEVGIKGLNSSWLDALSDYPLSVGFLKNMMERENAHFPFWPQLVFRNLVFLIIVLTHGFRRLLPPY